MITDSISLLIFCGAFFFLYRAYDSNKKNNRHIAIIDLSVAIIMAIFSIIGFLRIRNLIVYGVLIVSYYVIMGFYMSNMKKQNALKTKAQSSNKTKFHASKKSKK